MYYKLDEKNKLRPVTGLMEWGNELEKLEEAGRRVVQHTLLVQPTPQPPLKGGPHTPPEPESNKEPHVEVETTFTGLAQIPFLTVVHFLKDEAPLDISPRTMSKTFARAEATHERILKNLQSHGYVEFSKTQGKRLS